MSSVLPVQPSLPRLPDGFEDRSDLARTATPRDLKRAPRHRWFFFPHSFSDQLVHEILDSWDLPSGAIVADNFVGSGTSLLVARERGFSTVGYDLSPLAVKVTNAKVAPYCPNQLQAVLEQIVSSRHEHQKSMDLPSRITKAFSHQELKVIYGLINAIHRLPWRVRQFFELSLLWTARRFSRAVPDGGWLRWSKWPDQSSSILPGFKSNTAKMIADTGSHKLCESLGFPVAKLADARSLPHPPESVHGLITSPPYANRHDYSRIFHIDLLLLGQTESSVTDFRHQSFRSHVEARQPLSFAGRLKAYSEPTLLQEKLASFPADFDNRIPRLLRGYFEDMFLTLQEVARILHPGGVAAVVIGNVRYAGIMIPVDEILRQLASQAGLAFETAWVLRHRGNSAQQMGRHGREPARESVLFLSKADNG